MLRDRELWACAATVLHQHGDAAPVFVAERIGALVLNGEAEGNATWKAIARRMEEMRSPDLTDHDGATGRSKKS